MISLKNKVALVTGGSRGIGRAVVKMLAQAGADVVINYRTDDSAAKSIKEEIEKLGVRALAIKADVASQVQVDQMLKETVEKMGQIDIFVSNAGIWEDNPIDTMTAESLKRTIDVNLYGTFYPLMATVPYMKKQKSGNIILISSTAGQRGEAFHSPYSATKSAVIGITKSLAPELADYNIRVNCVAPGWVDTDMSKPSMADPKTAEWVLSFIPLNRIGTPEELAGPVLFLASDLSTFITGEILNVNGGAVLCG